MPCVKCSNNKWRVGSGPCMYTSKENCEKAERAWLAKTYGDDEENELDVSPEIFDLIRKYITGEMVVNCGDNCEELHGLIEEFTFRLMQLPEFFKPD